MPPVNIYDGWYNAQPMVKRRIAGTAVSDGLGIFLRCLDVRFAWSLPIEPTATMSPVMGFTCIGPGHKLPHRP